MHVIMYKQKECNSFVWYKFESVVAGNKYIDQRGRKRHKITTKQGLFVFNKKINNPQENALEIIQNKTDKILWNDKRTLIKCLVKMIQCKKKGYFPKIIEYASC